MNRPLEFVLLRLTIAIFFAASLPGANEDVALQIKAAYLLNFARFVEWPQTAPDVSSPVVIAVLGHDPIVSALETTVLGKNIKGHPIKIKEFASAQEIDHCDILFVPRSESKKSRVILAGLSERPILTVGETSGFLGLGGAIEFQSIEDTLRFSINVGSADRSGLRISSDLLRVAFSVTGKKK